MYRVQSCMVYIHITTHLAVRIPPAVPPIYTLEGEKTIGSVLAQVLLTSSHFLPLQEKATVFNSKTLKIALMLLFF